MFVVVKLTAPQAAVAKRRVEKIENAPQAHLL